MKNIYVCMGSACHLKGAEEVAKIFMRKIEESDLKSKVTLKGSFCLGPCLEAVVVKVGDTFVKNVRPENAEEVFEEKIKPLILEE
ncbi:MAG TPA: (2Fe-2S) ferredoxin domain-containing protein [Thermotogaceae bacterium]|nr:(2Fe-2S) ferredoxin domain-containing protein [Thermotogota bacterium]HEW91128.1 (2Fe-2S) ferredoxin domain-containing protein [Thermotogaceae bacterium]